MRSESIRNYLHWVRRFRRYCQAQGLDERPELTRDGAIRFVNHYIGPRTKGPVAPITRPSACHALHAWACGLRALGIPVPVWRQPPAGARLTPILAAYAQYRRAQCGIATTTMKRDLAIAQAFLGLLRRRGRSVQRIRVGDLEAFVTLQTRHVSTRTVVDGCSALRSFLRFLRVTGRTPRNFAESVLAPRFRADRPPRGLPWVDVCRILRAIPQDVPPGKRDYAMLLLMAVYGFGAAEVLHLSLDDLDWKHRVLRTRRPKTGQLIEVPLLPPIARAVAAYIRDERPLPTPMRRIFVSTSLPYAPLTSGAIRHRIREYAGRVGIEAPVIGAHAFRHSHATRQIDAGANPQVVGDILGHRRPSSTSVYVRVALRRLRTVALPVPR
jgi:site-specific recombinase XerD